MRPNKRLAKCFGSAVVVNAGVICAVGYTHATHPPTVEEVLNPVRIESYKPKPVTRPKIQAAQPRKSANRSAPARTGRRATSPSAAKSTAIAKVTTRLTNGKPNRQLKPAAEKARLTPKTADASKIALNRRQNTANGRKTTANGQKATPNRSKIALSREKKTPTRRTTGHGKPRLARNIPQSGQHRTATKTAQNQTGATHPNLNSPRPTTGHTPRLAQGGNKPSSAPRTRAAAVKPGTRLGAGRPRIAANLPGSGRSTGTFGRPEASASVSKTAAPGKGLAAKNQGKQPHPPASPKNGKLMVRAWPVKPGQKLVLPDKLDRKLLENLTNASVGNVSLTAEQREQVRKMLEGKNLTQLSGLDREFLKDLVKKAKAADEAPADDAADFLLPTEKKPRTPTTKKAGVNTAKTSNVPPTAKKLAALPTDTNSPFRTRPWSMAYSSRYEKIAEDAEKEAQDKTLLPGGPDTARRPETPPTTPTAPETAGTTGARKGTGQEPLAGAGSSNGSSRNPNGDGNDKNGAGPLGGGNDDGKSGPVGTGAGGNGANKGNGPVGAGNGAGGNGKSNGPVGAGSGAGTGSKGTGPVGAGTGGSGGKGNGPVGSGSGGNGGKGNGPVGGGNGKGAGGNGPVGTGTGGAGNGKGTGGLGTTGGGGGGNGGGGGFPGGGGGNGGGGGDAGFSPDMVAEGADFGGLLESEAGGDVTDEGNGPVKVGKANSKLNAGGLQVLSTASTPSTPNPPEHNHEQQKGIPGALILPPLPPLGETNGQEDEPHPVQQSHSGQPALEAVAPPVKPQPRPEPAPRLVEAPRPRPVIQPAPRHQPPADIVPLSLMLGSSSDQGTVSIAADEHVRLPLGTVAEVNPPRNAGPRMPVITSVPAAQPAPRADTKTSGKEKSPSRMTRVAKQLVAKFTPARPDKAAEATAPRPEAKANNSRGIPEGSVNPLPPVPLPESDSEIGDGSGLKGEYYLGTGFEQYQFTRADKNLDLFWGSDASPNSKLPPGGNWSCRWTGKIQARYSEDYTLYACADDGVRVWLDHKLIIDHWAWAPRLLEFSAVVKLEKGKQYDLRVDYFQNHGPAAIGLYWESSHQVKEFIPEECLFYPLPEADDALKQYEMPR